MCDVSSVIEDGYSNPLLTDYAWFCGNNETFGAKEVAQKLPNGFGLYDMLGNAYEWTTDRYGCSFPQEDGAWCTNEGNERVVRGGSWGSYSGHVTVSDRINVVEGFMFSSGFRVVRIVQ